jgi:polyvinyl alcohol dehydrogenase (cytochrome)
VTDDSVYFADVAGVMYCLDRETGDERWQVDSKASTFPGAHHANLLMASPILADGKIIFGGGAYEHPHPLIPGYECCRGRGFVVALDPNDGEIIWKYDVGPEPEQFDPPIVIEDAFGTHTFHYGPSTSSVWCTPSWDAESNTVYFGTDIHNSPRRPTQDDPRNYTEHSAAVIAVSGDDGSEKWVSQLAAGDVWNHSMAPYDPETGNYKDRAVGDTPKLLTIDIDGQQTEVLGVGCKNGGFYILRRDTGAIIAQTPIYTGPPVASPEVDPRMLALPSAIGGLQTGCATDGERIYVNGIDRLPNANYEQWWLPNPPTGGRVTAISLDSRTEFWRHERPKIEWIGGTEEKPLFENCGDPVASGIAVANGVCFCTTFSSNKLLAINAATGELLFEVPIGPVLCGPSISRGLVYVGTGNTQFYDSDTEAYFPKRYTGEILCFGLPDENDSPETQ